MIDPRLTTYIDGARARGASAEQVVDDLTRRGVPDAAELLQRYMAMPVNDGTGRPRAQVNFGDPAESHRPRGASG